MKKISYFFRAEFSLSGYVRIVCLFWLLLCITNIVQAKPDNRGKEFWVTFLPNYHNRENKDSLHITIIGDSATTGKITWRNIRSEVFTQDFVITGIQRSFQFSLAYKDIELEGFNNSGEMDYKDRQNERPAPQYIHIQADKSVAAYALNYAAATSEAALLLPVENLAEDYIIITYNSDGYISPFNFKPDIQSTPSQFAIVATEDSTKVTIIPSAETARYDAAIKEVFLNKGDSYLVQAKINFNNDKRDMAGTQILATKKVAVFTGHQRATIPVGPQTLDRSRNYLFEQVPPLRTLGQKFLITPFPVPSGFQNDSLDIFRIAAAYDSTVISINGVENRILMRGMILEGKLESTYFLETSKPALAAVFKRTSQIRGSSRYMSDPVMVIIPPIEQFLDSIRFTTQQGGDTVVFKEHYALIIAPGVSVSSLRLNGDLLNSSTFRSIGTSLYSYGVLKLKEEDSYLLKGDSSIMAVIVGYGSADAYGFAAGTGMSIVDFTPPTVTTILVETDSCKRYVKALIYDNSISDEGIAQLIIDTLSTRNINVIKEPVSTSRVWSYDFKVRDIYQDAIFSFSVRDFAGNARDFSDTIPGLTIDFPNVTSNSADFIYTVDCVIGQLLCDTIVIRNYGLFPMVFSEPRIQRNIEFSTSLSRFPLKILPGEEKTLYVCYEPTSIGEHTDSLSFRLGCVQRTIALQGIASPQIFTGMTRCNIPVKLTSGANVVLKESALNIFPNPASEDFSVHYELSASSDIVIKLIHTITTFQYPIYTGYIKSGKYILSVNSTDIPSGQYICMMYAQNKTYTQLINIVK